MNQNIKVKISPNIDAIPLSSWNVLVSEDNPFLEHEFLKCLEDSQCIGPRTSWRPHYITAWENKKLIGALPFFIRYDSYGEFIFDWTWANAAHRAGMPYYPKATVAAPFTPANGERVLVHPNSDWTQVSTLLIKKALDEATKHHLSSIHFLYLKESEMNLLENFNFLSRMTYQFHWENRNYEKFDDYLADLHRKKRQQIKKERKIINESNLQINIFTGDQIKNEHMESLWDFYLKTHMEKMNNPYLNRDFFKLAVQKLRHRLVLVMAKKNNEWIAGTLNFRKGKTLYGRYWGAIEHIPFLHFECCLYQLIEYAIKNKITKFEAGAQGEQKFLRGFITRPTYSSHWFAHSHFQEAVKKFIEKEKSQTIDIIKKYNAISPLTYVRQQI